MDKTNGYKATDSYYYWTVMYRLLKNAYFVNRECSKNNGNVCQTSSDQKVNEYSWNIGFNNKNASLISPTVGNPDSVKTPLAVNNGVVTIYVSELPVFVGLVN